MQEKLLGAVGDFTYYEYDGAADDTILLVVYGVTARAARAAVRELRASGLKVALLVSENPLSGAGGVYSPVSLREKPR